MTDKIPMKRCGTLEEIAGLVSFIASKEVGSQSTEPCVVWKSHADVLGSNICTGQLHHCLHVRRDWRARNLLI